MAAMKPPSYEKQANKGEFPSMYQRSMRELTLTKPRWRCSSRFHPQTGHWLTGGWLSLRPNLSDLGRDELAVGPGYWVLTDIHDFRHCMHYTVAGGHTPSSPLRRRRIPS